jgi:hypothetical protein
MARPRVINPNDKTCRVLVTVPEPVAQKLAKEAMKQGVSVSETVRQKLAP